ncbi:MAG TPA: type II toxin-antitoxin system HicB family antitoxin [Solirubrobacteraceae bacterium]
MENKQYEVVLVPQAEGGFVVSVPELPGVVTEGDTVAEALAMAEDAIEGYLATVRDQGWELPSVRREQVAVSG